MFFYLEVVLYLLNIVDDGFAQGLYVLLVHVGADNIVTEIEVCRRDNNAAAFGFPISLIIALSIVQRIFTSGITVVNFSREFLHMLSWLAVFFFIRVNYIIVFTFYLCPAVASLNHC